MKFEGILPILKPSGWTSHDVVAKMRKLLNVKRIGHTGTLDPQVTGVLPLCIGRATRVVEYMQERSKAYTAVIQFGIETDTQDTTGSVINREKVTVSLHDVEQVVNSFEGQQEQIPPMYSAIKIDGKKLYELARSGQTIERNSRTITIHEIKITDHHLTQDYPEVTVDVLCSKGTYIRTLCVDIGAKLGVPAVMKELIRTQSGSIKLTQCYTLEDIENALKAGDIEDKFLPIDEGVKHLVRADILEEATTIARHGQSLKVSYMHTENELQPIIYRCYDCKNEFMGLYRFIQEENIFKPIKLFI